MAQIDYNFPRADFSGLAEIPQIYEESRKTAARRNLGELKLDTAQGLEEAANRAFREGLTEEGLKFLTAATARRELARRTAADTLFQQYGPLLGAALRPGATPPTGPQPAGESAMPDIFQPAPSPPAAAPPPNFGPNPLAAPGPQSAAPPSPTEEVLARAEGAQSPAAQPVQLAGPPPTPDTAQPDFPMLAAQSGAITAPSPTLPQNQPNAGLPQPPKFSGDTEEQRAFEEAKYWAGIASQLGPRASPSQRQAITSFLNNALGRSKVTEKRDAWYRENAERVFNGEPTIGYNEFQRAEGQRPEVFKSGLKKAEDVATETRKSQDLLSTISRMDALVNHPAFEAGEGTQAWNDTKARIRAFKDTLVATGVPLPEGLAENIDNITKSVPLREAFAALANSAVFAKLGSLGNQISNADRDFIVKIFPSLSLSVEGNRLLLNYFRELGRKNVEVGQLVNDYARAGKAGFNTKLSPFDIERIQTDFWNKEHNSLLVRNGKLTEFAQRLNMELAKSGQPQYRADGTPFEAAKNIGKIGADVATGLAEKMAPEFGIDFPQMMNDLRRMIRGNKPPYRRDENGP